MVQNYDSVVGNLIYHLPDNNLEIYAMHHQMVTNEWVKCD